MQEFRRPEWAACLSSSGALLTDLSESDISVLSTILELEDIDYFYVYHRTLAQWRLLTQTPEAYRPLNLNRGLKPPPPNFVKPASKSSSEKVSQPLPVQVSSVKLQEQESTSVRRKENSEPLPKPPEKVASVSEKVEKIQPKPNVLQMTLPAYTGFSSEIRELGRETVKLMDSIPGDCSYYLGMFQYSGINYLLLLFQSEDMRKKDPCVAKILPSREKRSYDDFIQILGIAEGSLTSED